MGITGCVLAKNEAKRIEKCINNISNIADEIIVIDNGSEDCTAELAKRSGAIVSICTDKKLDRARNEYLELASQEWIFVLDADECIDRTAREKVTRLIQEKKDCAAFMVPRYEYLGEGKWALIEICRLFRNDRRIRYTDTVMHASVTHSISRINGSRGKADFAIHHLDGLYGNGRMAEKRYRNIPLTMEDIREHRFQEKELYNLYSYLGLEYAALGDYEEAEYFYEKAMSIGSDYKLFANIYLAQSYLVQGRDLEAYREAEKLLCVKNDIRQRALLVLAEVELHRNNRNAVIDYCNQIEAYDCNNAANKLNLATLYMDTDREKAIAYLLEATRINPYIMEPVIYQNGEKMNVFSQQTSFLSCTKNAKELTEIL